MCEERIRLQSVFAETSVAFTEALNAQVLAVIQSRTDLAELDKAAADSAAKHKAARDELFNHISAHGC